MSSIEIHSKKKKPIPPIQRVVKYLLENEGWSSHSIEESGIDKLKYRILGDILVLPPFHIDSGNIESIDRAFRQVFKGIRCVVAHEGKISGELRKPNVIVLSEVDDLSTIHIENGIKFKLDVTKVMFAAGNGTERKRFGTFDVKDEVVVDMFAGIGYFSLPLAKHGKPKKLISIEKNPDSAHLLRQNVVLNKVENIISVLEGDNRIVGDELIGQCNRVMMGYLPSAEPFLSRAFELLSSAPSTLHYHYIAKKEDMETIPIEHITPHLKGRKLAIQHIENVKSYAPQLFHFVADVLIT